MPVSLKSNMTSPKSNLKHNTLAIFSPNLHSYSETFIHAHKDLPFRIKYYYGGQVPVYLENGKIDRLNLFQRLKRKLNNKLNFTEQSLYYSLKKEKVDCVLAEYGTCAAQSLQIVKLLKLPLVVHFHGYDASNKPILEQYKNKYKEVFQYASKVISVSGKMYNDLLKLECSKEKLLLNPYGPHDSFFDLEPDYLSRQFVAVGRFVEKKAPYLTIFSFRKVVNEFPDAKLIMAGNGDLLKLCKSLVHLLDLGNNIEFAGAIDRCQVSSLFSNSLAFLQHSVTAENGDSEGTPVAVLEAQAAALPVIATFHAGIPDVVINNKTGLLVAENDIDGMAYAMIRVLKEKGLARQLGEAGRKRVKENFSMQKHLKVLQQQIEMSMV